MKILHYALGFPPYRSGGLTKFCMDLMKEQVKEGHTVGLLWPGNVTPFRNRTRVKTGKPVEGIQSHEVINPCPVPYDEGITSFSAFENPGDITVYEAFLKALQPEVLHVHTFMGMHKNLLTAAKNLHIRIVFTAHDFFPICPKLSLFRNGAICLSGKECTECASCNATALPLWKADLLQTALYRSLKDSALVKKLRKSHRDEYLNDSREMQAEPTGTGTPADYLSLRAYYRSFLELADCIHYNSTLTKSVYETYLGEFPSVVLPISHGDIVDRRKERTYNSPVLRVSYMGPYSAGKGYRDLRAALDERFAERKDVLLNVYFRTENPAPYEVQHDRYTYKDLPGIYEETDIVVVPSKFYETFGYTALEALSYGVPVLVTDHVGAKDLLSKGQGVVTEPGKEGLKKALAQINNEKLAEMNRAILAEDAVVTVSEMSRAISEQCYR